MTNIKTCIVLCFACCASCDGVSADERGIYALGEDRQLILASECRATIREAGEFSYIGSWEKLAIENKERIVVRLRDETSWLIDGEANVFVFDSNQANGTIRIYASGEGPDVMGSRIINGIQRASSQEHVCTNITLGVSETLDKEIKAAYEKYDAPLREMRRMKQEAQVNELLRGNPKLLMKVRLEYPQLDPEESIPDAESLPLLYPKAMRLVFDILQDETIVIEKTTLETLLDRIDWDRGDVLALTILGRKELDVGSLQKYSQKALSRIGKSDRYYLSKYFARSDLPKGVYEAAKAKGYDE